MILLFFLPMQNHGPHEHRQVDQSRQGHGSDVANCGTHTSRLGRFAHLAEHDDLTRKTKKCVCLTHLPHTICNKPRAGPPRVCLETVWSENQLKLWQCLHPLPAEQSGGQAPPRRSAGDPPGEWEQTFWISREPVPRKNGCWITPRRGCAFLPRESYKRLKENAFIFIVCLIIATGWRL